MKKKELEKLLRLIDKNDRRSVNFSEFKNPEKSEETFNQLDFIRENMPVYERDFSPFFMERIMGRISNLRENQGIVEYLSMQFSRVMAYGTAAVIIVFLTLYFIHGQDGFGTILGADSSNDINFISSLFYEF